MGKNIFAMCFVTLGSSKTKCRDLLRENELIHRQNITNKMT